jgi:DNA repair protein SbcC/Rad50
VRLHRLEIQAFGPFADRQVLDLDAVADSGLFLLHGPTGAGKTSVLDAACFALFGRVPGTRGNLTRLRSDHADPQLAPEVVCEFSVGTRRLEITRSPAWERPKRRGGGTTTAQAHVELRELVDGRWHALSARIDEVGDFVSQLLGMGVDQFTKLVLLPQGEFTAFLRADAESRRVMLERLFGTDRYTQVPAWLREQRVALLAEVEAARSRGNQLVARAEQVAVTVLPPTEAASAQTEVSQTEVSQTEVSQTEVSQTEVSQTEVSRTEVSRTEVSRVSDLLHRCELALEEAALRRDRARTALAAADAGNRHSSAAATRARRWLDDTARLGELESVGPARLQWQQRLAGGDRAGALAPLAPMLRVAEAQEQSARVRLAAARTAWVCAAETIGESSHESGHESGQADATDQSHEDLEDTQRRLSAWVTLVTNALSESDGLAAVTARMTELQAARAAAVTRRALLQAQLTEAEQTSARQLEAATAEDARVAGAGAIRQAHDRAVQVATAVAERDNLRAGLAAVQTGCTCTESVRNLAWQRWLQLRERRLAGIAAELAADLAAGRSCRVCGSTEHPDPALADGPAVTDLLEQQAHDEHQQAQAEYDRAVAVLADRQRRLAAAEAVAGDVSAEQAERTRRESAAQLRRTAEAEQRAAACRGTAVQAQAGAATAAAALADLDRDEQRVHTELSVMQDRLVRARERESGLLGPDRDLATRRRHLSTAVAAVADLRAALEHDRGARATADGARASTTSAALAAGFATLTEAISALLADDERHALAQAVQGHDRDLTLVRARLAELAADARAGDEPPPDAARAARALDATTLAARRHDLEQATLDDDRAGGELALADSAVTQLRRLLSQLRRHVAVQLPLQQRYHELDELTRCLDGTGGGNTRKISLSAYVLATRLDQVAQAASLRLAQMSDGRYGLEHCEEPQRGRVRSGLSLVVRDAWTGLTRETASLSGGEAFYTSLALALGLADVVTAEAGGTAIDTLFVDEGFGSLDDDTLDEVLDVLDGLRSGGRTVGLVSHVADLRRRIPTQVEVRRTPTGSTVHLVTATG